MTFRNIAREEIAWDTRPQIEAGTWRTRVWKCDLDVTKLGLGLIMD
jgi:hypothetical protein